MWKFKTSLSQKFLALFGAVVVLFMVGLYFVYQTSKKQTFITEGRAIANQIKLFRHWVAGYGGVWSKNSYLPTLGYLMAEETKDGVIKTAKGHVIGKEKGTVFYEHNPALATRELSTIAEETGIKFRVVSDRPMSPANMPNRWELEAIKKFKKNRNLDEIYGFNGGKFYYASPLYVTKACLKCHGKPGEQVSPEIEKALIDKYGQNALRALNYKEGDLRGIITVIIDPNKTRIPGFLRYFSWVEITIIVFAFGLLYFFVRKIIVQPIETLTSATEKIAKGRFSEAEKELEKFSVKELKGFEVKDEISRLAIAIDSLKNSIQLAVKKLKRK
jgi:HAMP domain-containing protein